MHKVVKKPSSQKKKDPSEDKGKKDVYEPLFPDRKSKNPNAIFDNKKNKENQIFKEGKKNPSRHTTLFFLPLMFVV